MPSLTIREHGGRCRLRLADAWGDGATLQEAADDLVARVVRHAGALRGGGWAWGPRRAARTSVGWTSSTRWGRLPCAAAMSAAASSGRDSYLLDRHGDPEALLGRDQVVVVVERGVELDPLDLAVEVPVGARVV